MYVGSPLTPNALNGGNAGFPEFHNVYMEPCSYEQYKKTYVFPEGTIMFKSCNSHFLRRKTQTVREPSLLGGGIFLDL